MKPRSRPPQRSDQRHRSTRRGAWEERADQGDDGTRHGYSRFASVTRWGGVQRSTAHGRGEGDDAIDSAADGMWSDWGRPWARRPRRTSTAVRAEERAGRPRPAALSPGSRRGHGDTGRGIGTRQQRGRTLRPYASISEVRWRVAAKRLLPPLVQRPAATGSCALRKRRACSTTSSMCAGESFQG